MCASNHVPRCFLWFYIQSHQWIYNIWGRCSDSSRWMNFKIFQGLKWSPLVTPRSLSFIFSSFPPHLMAHHFFHGSREPLMFSGGQKGHRRPVTSGLAMPAIFSYLSTHPFVLFEILWPLFLYSTQIKKSHTLQQPPQISTGETSTSGETERLLFRCPATWHVTPRRWGEPRIRAVLNTGQAINGFTGVHWFICKWPVVGIGYIEAATQNPWFLPSISKEA